MLRCDCEHFLWAQWESLDKILIQMFWNTMISATIPQLDCIFLHFPNSIVENAISINPTLDQTSFLDLFLLLAIQVWLNCSIEFTFLATNIATEFGSGSCLKFKPQKIELTIKAYAIKQKIVNTHRKQKIMRSILQHWREASVLGRYFSKITMKLPTEIRIK